MGDNIFRILEIEPTRDKKEIKRAYARLVKRYHPEEYPGEWKKIHDAYELALKMADNGQNILPVMAEPSGHEKKKPPVLERKLSVEDESDEHKKKPPVLEKKLSLEDKPDVQQDRNEEEIGVLFQEIGQLSKEQKEQGEETQKKALEAMKKEMRQMCAKERFEQSEWEAFFRREDMLPLFCTDEFLRELGECFTDRKIDGKLYRFLTEQLFTIEQYRNSRSITNKNILWDPIGVARVKIYSAYVQKRTAYDILKDMTAAAKALLWIVIVLLGIVGMYLRMTRIGIGRRAEQNRERDAYMQEFIENQQEYEGRSEQLRNELMAEIEILEGKNGIIQKSKEKSSIRNLRIASYSSVY